MYVTAKEFCKSTGFPSRLLIRYLRDGKIACHRAGRRYVIDKEQTEECLHMLAKSEKNVPVVYHKRKNRSNKNKDSSNIFDGIDNYQERISLLKKNVYGNK
ncbi:MAG: hypothetical protein K6G85_05425 [Eubacterium sp.]|nr:hypothetical protein [Eubacterium sp.]